ncbi:MAG: hypothetical protein ACMUJM_20235 [bacterium]
MEQCLKEILSVNSITLPFVTFSDLSRRSVRLSQKGKGVREYKEIAVALGKNSVITDKLSHQLRLMAG